MHASVRVSTARSDGLLSLESMLLVNKDQRYGSRHAEAAYCRCPMYVHRQLACVPMCHGPP